MKLYTLEPFIHSGLLLAFLLPAHAGAATLRPETVDAWDAYMQTVNAGFQNRLRPGGSFLWTFDDPARAAKVRSGEIVIEPVSGHCPMKVPGGLIHHWIGAVFVPGVTTDDVYQVIRNYNRYKDYYSPAVVDSKLLNRDGTHDRFTMDLMNRSFFLSSAMDADYLATVVRLDDRRAYSVSHTTRVQQVEDFGRPDERKIPEGQGGGYIWKLWGCTRMEERDGGVYLEIEAVGLSRDIPPALRFIVDPIVRRVSHNSLLLSLQQTGNAVRDHVASSAHPVDVTASAGHLPAASPAFSLKHSLIP